MQIEQPRNEATLFDAYNKDSVIDSIKQLKVLSKYVIAHMRRFGFFVIEYFDMEGRSRILTSITPIFRGQLKDTSVRKIKGEFISITIKSYDNRQSPEDILYQKQIERDGGIYVIASTAKQFYDWFNLTFKEGD